jgi:aryl-alcohol dehydrogenase-like predicted oxidoreductase
MTAETRIDSRRLGSPVSSGFPLALGCMGMSGMYGPGDENESIATLRAALDQGVNLDSERT